MAFRDIRRSRKWLSVEELRLLVLAFVLLAGLLALNLYLARLLPGGEQLFLRWSGARAFLAEGIEPYGSTIAGRAQEIAYGRPAFAGEYPYVLSDPFHIVLFYIPLALIRDFAVVRAVWMLLSQIALAWLMISFIRALEWEPPRWLFVLIVLGGVGGYYSLAAFGAGAPAVFLTVLFFAVLACLRSFSDELAGALLFLTAYQWEVGALFFLFILAFVIANRRWRVFYGFGMSLVILPAISFLAYPAWGLAYVRGVLANWYRSGPLTFGGHLSDLFPAVQIPLGVWVALLFAVILFLEWLGSFDAPFRRIVWTACLSLAVTPLMGLAIFPSNHVVLLPSLILILVLLWERWTRQRVWLTLLVLFASLIVPFWLYARIVAGAPQPYLDLLTVLPPVATIVGLYWMRWWAFRSPRTWFDKIAEWK